MGRNKGVRYKKDINGYIDTFYDDETGVSVPQAELSNAAYTALMNARKSTLVLLAETGKRVWLDTMSEEDEEIIHAALLLLLTHTPSSVTIAVLNEAFINNPILSHYIRTGEVKREFT